tara:strand:- start:1544 stop:1660 length:117 start_codon:yes stop_codon:yes gene_type:complete
MEVIVKLINFRLENEEFATLIMTPIIIGAKARLIRSRF